MALLQYQDLKVVRIHLHSPGLAQIDRSPILSYLLAYERLVRNAFSPSELPALIDAILLNKEEGQRIRLLSVDDAQVFIDAVDKVHFTFARHNYFRIEIHIDVFCEQMLRLPDLSFQTQKQCLKLMYRMCGHYALLPTALEVSAKYNQNGIAPFRGGYGDVWKGECCGRNVAVKVIRTYSNRELQKVVNVSSRFYCFVLYTTC